jgi:hypothetical protein
MTLQEARGCPEFKFWKENFSIESLGAAILFSLVFLMIYIENLNPTTWLSKKITTWPGEAKPSRTLVRPCRCCCYFRNNINKN